MAVVVITGCSSGFGLESALAFARNGDTVYATMRNLAKADRLRRRADSEGLTIYLRQLDVNDTAAFPAFVEDIVANSQRLDILVNNAGINRAGALEDITEDTFRTVMETNCMAPLLLTRAVLPQMRRQNHGLIIMMSSLSGVAGLPGDVSYTASKFALEGATEALRHEVDRWGIRVALVQAGLYATDIFDHTLSGEDLLPEDYPPDSPYKPMVQHQLDGLAQRLPEAFDPRQVAELFVEIAQSPRSQLRWPADDVAERVLRTMFAQTDDERDAFLQSVSGQRWWSEGRQGPDANSD